MKPAPNQYERYRDLLRGQRLPLAFVDLDQFDRNIQYVAKLQQGTGKPVRLHTKSLRCVPLLQRILQIGGDIFQGLMTFTTEETAWLAGQGFDDLIVAYPTVQDSDLDLLVELTRAGTQVMVMVDSTEQLDRLDAAGRRGGAVLQACLELDLAYRPVGRKVHLGMRRSPVRTVADAVAVARHAQGLKHAAITGLMGYEGHIAGINDDVPGHTVKNRMLRTLKQASIRELTHRRTAVVRALRDLGVELRVVNGGGSGSLKSTTADPSVTEVTAGSAFYAPGLFWHYRDVSFAPSAFFACQIVRRPTPDIVTCLGGGYVASGGAGPDRLPVPVYPPGLELIPLEGAGEVQTPLKLPAGAPRLELGDPIVFQHAKAGELTERFAEFVLVSGDQIVGRAETYRGAGQTFL